VEVAKKKGKAGRYQKRMNLYYFLNQKMETKEYDLKTLVLTREFACQGLFKI